MPPLQPGDLTYVMALPWQDDFYAVRGQLVAGAAAELRDARRGCGPGRSSPAWSSGGQGMVDNWHKLGFVVRQGASSWRWTAATCPASTC